MLKGYVVIEKDLINKRYFDKIWGFEDEMEARTFCDEKNRLVEKQRDSEVDMTYHYQKLNEVK